MTDNCTAIAAMLIRKPIDEVFRAFTDPRITTQFWFTESTGPLEAGKTVEWPWGMYHFSLPIVVKSIVENKSLEMEWGNPGSVTTVEWTFQPIGDGATFVQIVNRGFTGNAEQILSQVRGSTEGFTLVLAGLKAWLEHGIRLNLVADRFPQGL